MSTPVPTFQPPAFESFRRNARRLAPALLVAAGTIVFFCALEARFPYYFLWDDNASANLPGFVHNWRALTEEGVLAHINLHQYLGQIWLGNGQSAVLYPPIYLAAAIAEVLWGDLRATIEILAILHFAVGALGMLALFRLHQVSGWIAILGALLWVTMPFHAMVARNWIFVAFVVGLAPWNLWLLIRLSRAPSFSGMFWLAALKALLFYQGHANYAVMVALFDVIYLLAGWALVPARRDLWAKAALGYLGALLMTGALAAPLLLPMLEAQQMSAYRADRLPLEEFLSNALRLPTFVRTQLLLVQEKAVHQSTSALFYFGLTNFALLGALMLPRLRRVKKLAPALAAGATSVLALALATKASILLYPLPVFSSFRWPFKYFLLFLLFSTLAAVCAGDRLTRGASWAGRTAVFALLTTALAANAMVLFQKNWNRPFGPNRLVEPVWASSQGASERLRQPSQGRVVSLWQTHAEATTPVHLTHNSASLVGAYHLGGYDPLIAKSNLDLALGLDYSNIFRHQLDERLLAYFSSWSVRFFTAPPRHQATARLEQWPQLTQLYRDHQVQIWQNDEALPLVSQRSRPRIEVPFEWRTNGLDIDTSDTTGAQGDLRVAVAPLPWWYVSIDGERFQPASFDPDHQMTISLPDGASKVTIRYRNVPFRLGLGLAVALLLSVLTTWLIRRRSSLAPAVR